MVWFANFAPSFHIKVYNSSNELIYTSPEYLPPGLFFTYQNECSCLPVTDFEGVYIQEENQVNLSWNAPETPALLGFDIYRNDIPIAKVAPTVIFYSDSTANLESGIYKYCVIPVYTAVCNLEDACFETPINVGIKDYSDNIMIYPNPANDVIHITGTDIANVKVFNNIGQLILTQHNTNTINISALQNGFYILSVETINRQITQKKLIINH